MKLNLLNVKELKHWENYFRKYFEVIHNDNSGKIKTLVFNDSDTLISDRNKNNNYFIPNYYMCKLFSDKIKTNLWLKEKGFNTTNIIKLTKNFKATKKIITKPNFSSGRVGFKVWETGEKVNAPIGSLVQDFIEGKEYNLDILKDKNNSVYVCAKEKLLIKAGATFKSKLTNSGSIVGLGKALAKYIPYVGSIDVDLIVDSKNVPYIIDINPRLGGGFLHSVNLDENFEKCFLNILNDKDFGFYNQIYGNNYISQIEYNYTRSLDYETE